MRVDRRVQVVAGHLERRGGGRIGRLVHVLDVVGVGGVLDDHLRVHLDPVDHLGVRMQRVVLAGFQLRQHRRLPVRGPAVPLVPGQHEAVPLHARVGADADVVLAADLAVGNQRVAAVAAPLPPVPGADDVLALHGAADAEVGAQMLTVGVHHVHPPRRGAEQHQLLAEVVRALDLAGGQVGSERHDEPARREPVGRQCDAGLPELPLRRILGRIGGRIRNCTRHLHSVSRPDQRRAGRRPALTAVRRQGLFLLF
ncbi:hypothetical protein PICSAR181_01158 [Mycobacterium avium subsp. paratuberculosis]|nr:hypothetical protein PICSAR181_01158 [Mycobacterium avium subsp. paratuberculosis]